MKYRTCDDRLRVETCPGDPMHVEYQSQYDIDGNLVLKETGKTNIYLEIQSHKESTDINCLIAQYKNGDEMALNRVQGYYQDISDIPDIHSLYNMLKAAEQDFTQLPTELKQKFDNNFEKYLFMVGSEDWFDLMQVPAPEKPDIKEEVNTDGE